MKRPLLIVILLPLIFIECSNKSETQNSQGFGRMGMGAGGFGQRSTSVEAQPVNIGTISEQVRSYGTIKAQNIVQVSPQVSNRITKIYVDLGDEVKKGQSLAKIYDATFRDQLNQAKSQLEQSKVALQRDSTQFARQKSLYDRGLSSDAEYDIALSTYRSSSAQYQSAIASLTQAQENFNNTLVKSPVDGVILSRNFEEGDLASTGQALFEIANTVGYESRVFIPVQDWRNVTIGQEVTLRTSNEEGITTRGVVSKKSPHLDPTTGLGEVVITLNQMGSSIFPGVLVENVINISTKERAIIVPRSALVEKIETVINPESNTIDLKRSYAVFVTRGDSVAERRELQLGIEQGDKIEVLSGLRPNDKIIVIGQQGLEDGSRIMVATGDRFKAPEQRTIEPNATNGSNVRGTRNAAGANPMANMSEEERAKIRTQTEGMSPEERRAFIQKLRTQSADSTSKN
ncbi:MAG: efflux RND transporter periplasmic adaptor subunit [Balneolaceae bacterium]